MEYLLEYGISRAVAQGATFVEITARESEEKQIVMTNGQLASKANQERGVSIRLIASGRWGYAAGPATNKTAINQLVKWALSVAEIQPPPEFPVELSKNIPSVAGWQSKCEKDPFSLSEAEFAALLAEADQAMAVPGVVVRRGKLYFRRQSQQYLNSEGSSNCQVLTLSGAGLKVIAAKNGELQQRSWPGPKGSYATAGYEFIEGLALPGHGRKLAEESVELLRASSCPQGIFDVIITGSLLAQQLLCTLGASLTLGNPPISVHQRLASNEVSLLADATLPGGAGSYGFDAEGIKAQSFTLIDRGQGVGFLTGRESAAAIGSFSSGCMGYNSWFQPPSPGPTNLVLKPGNQDLGQLIGGIERGLIIDTPRVPVSLAPRQRSFVGRGELGWLIEQGAISHMVKDPFYRGNTFAFWNGCDGAADAAHQETIGFLAGIKGVGCCVVPLRFRGVRVGEGR